MDLVLLQQFAILVVERPLAMMFLLRGDVGSPNPVAARLRRLPPATVRHASGVCHGPSDLRRLMYDPLIGGVTKPVAALATGSRRVKDRRDAPQVGNAEAP
jgi:hypothetical protein